MDAKLVARGAAEDVNVRKVYFPIEGENENVPEMKMAVRKANSCLL